jgi:DMSO/TMAO reductase YedYZ molybdopterin-dependent catalytic subunit
LVVLAIVILLGVSIYYFTENSALPPALPAGTPPDVELKITGDVETEKTLTIADLKQMPLTLVTQTSDGETANYVGIEVTELLKNVGAEWDVGLVSFRSEDVTKCTIDTYQAYNSTLFSGYEFILAFAKNGQWLSNQPQGPFVLVAPGLERNKVVFGITEINLQPWIIVVNGAVNKQLIITGKDLEDYQTKTVQATYAPPDGPQRVSNWTGITLSSILQVSGVSSDASKVTISAVDGYSKDFSLQEAQNLGLLIGYQENGVALSKVESQPFRLVVPSEEFKWAQFWVKWVSEIKVT